MEKLLFGISGIPLGDGSRRLVHSSGIEYLASIGLDAMEVLFVRSVNVTDKNKDEILRAKKEHGMYLSAHGSYYINLNAETVPMQEQSLERIRKGAEALLKIQGRSLIFHPGFYLKDSKEETYATIKSNLMRLPKIGIDYRLETTGKITQFGTVEELTALCREIGTCKLCLDFAHIHARSNGGLKTYKDIAGVLQYVENELGEAALRDIHIHVAGIRYNQKGELRHLPLQESDFPYVDFLRALKDFEVKGCLIAEGPTLEHDALLMKKVYETL